MTIRVLVPRKRRESLFSAISVGVFFLLVGTLFIITPNLFEKILTFFRDLDFIQIAQHVIALSPKSPETHTVLYKAVWEFCLVWGVFQVVLLALRFIVRSPVRKMAETGSNIVFWLGVTYLAGIFLNERLTPTTWFLFWSEVIMIAGFSLIVRAIILAARGLFFHS